MTPSQRHQPASDELHDYDALESPSSIESPHARRRNQTIQKIRKQEKSKTSEQQGRERNGATIKLTNISGTQREKSSNVKKEKTRKHKDAEHLHQERNGSETFEEDYTIPLNDRKDHFFGDNSAKLPMTSQDSRVGRADRSKSRKTIDYPAGTSRTPCTPHSTKTSYFELDLAHGSTPMSLISMDEFDWLEDLYYEDSQVQGRHANSTSSAPESDEYEVISAALDHAEKIMNDDDYSECMPASSQMSNNINVGNINVGNVNLAIVSGRHVEPILNPTSRTSSTQTKQALSTPSSVAKTAAKTSLESARDRDNCNVIAAPIVHGEKIRKKNSSTPPQLKQSLLRTQSSLSAQKKTNSSEGGISSTISKDDRHGRGKKKGVNVDEKAKHSDGICTESYLESSEWKAQEQLRKDWIHFIANHRPRPSRLNHYRSSSVPPVKAVAPSVTPRQLGAKSTSLHVTRSDIRSLSSSSTPPTSPLNGEPLVLSLESWEVEQRKAVLESKFKDARRNNSATTRQRRPSCTSKVQKS